MYCRVPGRGQSAGGGCEGEQEQERESERVSLLVKSLFLGGREAVLGLDLSKAMRSKDRL